MKTIKNNTLRILEHYKELINIAEGFIYEKNNYSSYPTIRFDDNGNIETEDNIACHCHPDYVWNSAATLDEFVEWMAKKDKEGNLPLYFNAE